MAFWGPDPLSRWLCGEFFSMGIFCLDLDNFLWPNSLVLNPMYVSIQGGWKDFLPCLSCLLPLAKISAPQWLWWGWWWQHWGRRGIAGWWQGLGCSHGLDWFQQEGAWDHHRHHHSYPCDASLPVKTITTMMMTAGDSNWPRPRWPWWPRWPRWNHKCRQQIMAWPQCVWWWPQCRSHYRISLIK